MGEGREGLGREGAGDELVMGEFGNDADAKLAWRYLGKSGGQVESSIN